MTIKEELAEEMKDGGSQAEFDALNALEAEAKEFDKVYTNQVK